MFEKPDTSKLERQLTLLSDLNITDLTKEAAELVLRSALSNVPVDTGELKNSGEVVKYEDGGVVKYEDGYAVQFTAGHAVHVEYGTSRQKAQPFLRPAVDGNESEIVKSVGEQVEKELKAKI